MSSDRLARMTALGDRYIDNKQVAGMVNLVMRNGKVVHYQAHGSRAQTMTARYRKMTYFASTQ